MYAIEEGIRLKENFGGKVIVISLGPPQAINALKEAIGMGADEAIQLSDRAFAGSDSWATAYTLALAIKKFGEFDIILCGKQAIDGDTGQVGPGIASQLGITQLTYVFKIIKMEPEADIITVERLLEEGREILAAKLPVLLTAVNISISRANHTFSYSPRCPAKDSGMDCSRFTEADLSKLGLMGSPTQVIKISSPPKREGVLELIKTESVEQSAAVLADKIIAEKIL